MINKNTRVFFSVASNPGNKGANFYNLYFKKKKINAIYIPLKLSSDFKQTLQIFKKIGVAGCSVSMPFKKEAWDVVNKKPKYLNNVKSINTIVINNQITHGHSTDFYAVRKVLKSNDISRSKSIVIVGTGAMAKIFYENLNNKLKNIFFVSRKPKLKNHLTLNNIKKIQFDILINASPLGMLDFQSFPTKYFDFSNCKKILDVVAYPKKTDLSKFAKKKKINFIGGEIFSRLQAEKQLEIYKRTL